MVRRKPFLLIIAILLLIIIVIWAIGSMNGIKNFVSIYTVDGDSADKATFISLSDTFLGMIKCLKPSMGIESEFYDRYLVGRVEDNVVMTAISLYAVPIASMLVLFFSVIGFCKAIAALTAKKKSNGLYKKIGFGFLSIATFICAGIMVICP